MICIEKIGNPDGKFDGCKYRRDGLNELLYRHPKFGKLKCNRCVKDDDGDGVIAFLSMNQYVPGHTIVTMRNHYSGISDDRLKNKERNALFNAIQKISNRMMKKLTPTPLRIYVCSLGEDVIHLHFHLIPRYPKEWRHGSEEKEFWHYLNRFPKFEPDFNEDRKEGYWYLAFHETRWNHRPWEDITAGKEVEWFQDIAEKIRI